MEYNGLFLEGGTFHLSTTCCLDLGFENISLLAHGKAGGRRKPFPPYNQQFLALDSYLNAQ